MAGSLGFTDLPVGFMRGYPKPLLSYSERRIAKTPGRVTAELTCGAHHRLVVAVTPGDDGVVRSTDGGLMIVGPDTAHKLANDTAVGQDGA
jgi:hypothetical protein